MTTETTALDAYCTNGSSPPACEVGAAESWSPSKMPPLTPAADLAMARSVYPDGLWCTSPRACPHRVLATTAAGWSKSWPGVAQSERLVLRGLFVCASCRLDAEERARAGAALRAAREAKQVGEYGLPQNPSKNVNADAMLPGGFRVNRPLSRARARLAKAGRPRVADAVKKASATTRQRAYRERQKAAAIAANDALLAGAQP